MRVAALSAPLPETSPSTRKVFIVSAVVKRADQVLREKAQPLWIRGEISSWRRHPSGHCYFTLKDDQAELCCTLWASAARSLPALPENGMMIEVFGQLGIYAKKGQFQLEVMRLETTDAGGLWEVARERLIAMLRGEGLLDEDRKRPIPAYAERIGIVTSSQSAALQDMIRALRRKGWWTTTRISHCSVEGAGAAPEIAAAIRRFGASPERCPVELVIVARGGGSMESLWAYNMEEVARAIAACPVPVISAVGHETDYTVADFVADARAATPTAGAELAVPDGRQLLSGISDFEDTIRLRVRRSREQWAGQLARTQGEVERALDRRIAMLDVQLSAAERHLEACSPRVELHRIDEQLDRAAEDLHATMRQRLRQLTDDVGDAAEHLHVRSPRRAVDQAERDLARQNGWIREGMRSRLENLTHAAAGQSEDLHGRAAARLSGLEQKFAAAAEALDARSPLRVLARGYAVVSDAATGEVVRSPAEVAAEQRLRVRLAGGEITVRVENDASVAQPST
jgi:exodeoxyribonuclease VII large subunit